MYVFQNTESGEFVRWGSYWRMDLVPSPEEATPYSSRAAASSRITRIRTLLHSQPDCRVAEKLRKLQLVEVTFHEVELEPVEEEWAQLEE